MLVDGVHFPGRRIAVFHLRNHQVVMLDIARLTNNPNLKIQFNYDEASAMFICPNGQMLSSSFQ